MGSRSRIAAASSGTIRRVYLCTMPICSHTEQIGAARFIVLTDHATERQSHPILPSRSSWPKLDNISGNFVAQKCELGHTDRKKSAEHCPGLKADVSVKRSSPAQAIRNQRSFRSTRFINSGGVSRPSRWERTGRRFYSEAPAWKPSARTWISLLARRQLPEWNLEDRLGICSRSEQLRS